jgi:prolyl 4-hydroxylase
MPENKLAAPRRMSTVAVRIIAVAVIIALMFVYANFTTAAHDPLWWQHVGLKDRASTTTTTTTQQPSVSRRIFPVPPTTTEPRQQQKGSKLVDEKKAAVVEEDLPGLVRGVDYFADYRIRDVRIPPDPVATLGKPLKFQYINTSTSEVPFFWVSSKPRVAFVPNFLTDDECDNIIKTAEPRLERSQVAIRQNDANKNPINEVRTSSQTWLDTNSGPAKPIADKIFKMTGFQPGSSEMMQILRYELSQKYDAHQDYFDPESYGPQPTNRAVTVFLYFSTVEEGGETWFPGADNKPVLTQDYKSCKGGFGIKPRKRDAVIFYDMTPTGGYDLWSLHGGCPVKKGTKWGGTLWLRVPTA